MARTRQTGRGAQRYVLAIKLSDGEELFADPGEDLDGARAQLAALPQTTPGADSLVPLGRDTVVRGGDVRYVQLRAEGAGETGPGVIDTLRTKVGGGGMGDYETEQTSQRGGSRVARAGSQERGGPGFADQWVGYGRRPWSETKPFFLTSEFVTLLASIAAVAIAMAASDVLNADRGWLLITILVTAYIVSRGLAKSGTRDPNPRERGD